MRKRLSLLGVIVLHFITLFGQSRQIFGKIIDAVGRWIAEREEVALEDTVCVGDWINDVAMFELAGRSFAMGQAPDEVKEKATDTLSETVENGGGVARVIEEVFGIA